MPLSTNATTKKRQQATSSGILMGQSLELSSQESVDANKKGPLHEQQQQQDALSHSAAASQFLADQDFNHALESYQKALIQYKHEVSTVGQCNAAATLHNIALLHKRCRRYEECVSSFQQAEAVYRQCLANATIRAAADAQVEGHVCLDQLLVETLHSRAFVHQKYQQNLPMAIECHELVVETLLELDVNDKSETSSQARDEPPPNQEDAVVFCNMHSAQRVALLAESLKSLGMLYFERGDMEDSSSSYAEALQVLRCQHAENPDDVSVQKSIATVLINLASVYFTQDDFGQALDALQEAMDLWIAVEEDPSHPDVLATINNMGLGYERMGNLEKALEYYEDLLHVRSRLLGADHVDVAESLSTVAKVLERQGNSEGAFDLFHEALHIYRLAAADEDPKFWANVVDLLCRIAVIQLEEDHVDESIDTFQEALHICQETSVGEPEYLANIYHGLGRAYMVKKQYVDARESLLHAARLLEAVPDDDIDVESLVESSAMLHQALNNDSVLSSEGSWLNAVIAIEAKTPERMALATTMSPIGESRDYGSSPCGEASSDAQQSSLELARHSEPSSSTTLTPTETTLRSALISSQTPQSSNKVTYTTSDDVWKSPPISPARSNDRSASDEGFNPYCSPVSHHSQDAHSKDVSASDISIEARQVSAIDMSVLSDSSRRNRSPGRREVEGDDHADDDKLFLPDDAALSCFPLPSWHHSQISSSKVPTTKSPSTSVDGYTNQTAGDSMTNVRQGGPPDISAASQGTRGVPFQSGKGRLVFERNFGSTRSLPVPLVEANEIDVSALASPTADQGRSQKDNTDRFMAMSDTEATEFIATPTSEGFETFLDDPTIPDPDPETETHSPNPSDEESRQRHIMEFSDFESCSESDQVTADYTYDSYYDSRSRQESTLCDESRTTSSFGSDTLSERQESITIDNSENGGSFESETDAGSHSLSRETTSLGVTDTDDSESVSPETLESSFRTSEHDTDGATLEHTLDTTLNDTDNTANALFAPGPPEADGNPDGNPDSPELNISFEASAYTDRAFFTPVADTADSAESDSQSSQHDSDADKAYHTNAAVPRESDYAGTRFLGSDHDTTSETNLPNLLIDSDDGTSNDLLVSEDENDKAEEVQGMNHGKSSVAWSRARVPLSPASKTKHPRQETAPAQPVQTPSPTRSNKKRESSRGSPRVTLVKAFSHTFRRSRRRSRLESMPEDSEQKLSSPLRDAREGIQSRSSLDSTKVVEGSGPIPFVALDSTSGDDNVSQITFHADEINARKATEQIGGASRNTSWWWGGSTKGLESWFPDVVGAAEEFLSAQSIHDLVKSRKLDASSSEATGTESDPFDDLSAGGVERETDPAVASRNEEETEVAEQDTDEHTSEVEAPITLEEAEISSGKAPDDSKKAPSSTPKSAEEDSPAEKSVPEQAATQPPARSLPRRRKRSRERPQMSELQKTLRSQIAEHGNKHPNVARTLTSIAILQSQMGEKDAAVRQLQNALNIRKAIGDRAEIARAFHDLGDIHWQYEQFEASLSYYIEALNVERIEYGYCHPQIADTLNTIGTVHASRGEFDIAISNHQHALQILKDCVGEDLSHPLVTQTLVCIGAVYYKERNSLATIRAKSDGYGTFIEVGMLDVIGQAHDERGSYRMAVAFFDEKLQLLRSGKKADQREVAEVLIKLGNACRKAGVFHEAMDYYNEAFTIQSQGGRDQVEIAEARLLTGTIHFHLGLYKASLELLRQALSILQVTVGSNQDTIVAETLQKIGMVQSALCEYDGAMNALEKALKLQMNLAGDESPATLRTRLAIANVLTNRAEFDLAIEQLTAILEIQNRIHGPKHPNLAETMYHMACAYEGKGDIGTATKFFEESFFMAEEFLGNDHPAQASTLHGIADLQVKKGRHKKALALLAKVLSIRKETIGGKHIDTALTLCSIASCHAALGRFTDSAAFLDRALSIAEAAVGPAHPSVAQIHVGRASLFLRQCQFEETRSMIEKALEIYRRYIPDNHPQRLEAESILERVERDEMLFV